MGKVSGHALRPLRIYRSKMIIKIPARAPMPHQSFFSLGSDFMQAADFSSISEIIISHDEICSLIGNFPSESANTRMLVLVKSSKENKELNLSYAIEKFFDLSSSKNPHS